MLRFPLAIVVMQEHLWPHISTFGVSEYTWLQRFFQGFVCEYSVPVYLFLAGYFFFANIGPLDRPTYAGKVRRRLRTLVVPYFAWNTIAIAVKIVTAVCLMHLFGQTAYRMDLSLSAANLLNCYGYYDGSLIGTRLPDPTVPINAALWFLRNLMVVVLCTPIWYHLLKNKERGKVVLLFFMGLFLATRAWKLEGVVRDTVYQYLFTVAFFSWGAYLGIHRIDPAVHFRPWFKRVSLLYLGFGSLMAWLMFSHLPLGLTLKGVGMIAAVPLACLLADGAYRSGSRTTPEQVACGVFIYVSHLILLNIMEKLAYALSPHTEAGLLVGWMGVALVSAALLTGTFRLLRRYAPRLLRLLIGSNG